MDKPHIIDYILENTNAHSQQRLNQRHKSNWKKEFNLFTANHVTERMSMVGQLVLRVER